jgi:hypothetical protein
VSEKEKRRINSIPVGVHKTKVDNDDDSIQIRYRDTSVSMHESLQEARSSNVEHVLVD